MGFRPAGLNHIVSFNSQTSYKFLSDYNDFVTNKIRAKSLEPKHKTFAMSYIRCRRISWFRLRGVLPDKDEAPDLTLNFTADIGTACHKIIQSNLSEMYGDNWKINGEYYLIEIKTADYSSFDSLTEPKPQHVEQAIGYATVLKVHKVLFVYQDRQYGNIKCFEIEVSYPQMVEMWNMFSEVQKLADACIAPPKLPYGDVWCSSSRCPYFKKCKEW